MEYIIETQNLIKQYKEKTAVDDISIHVKRGDIYGLIGKNGAGKTTLMKLILGLTNPTQGKFFLFCNERLNEGRQKVRLLKPQDYIKIVRLMKICYVFLYFMIHLEPIYKAY